MKKLLLIALLGSAFGTVINVPDDYVTIQEGINAAVDTDTVLVAQGAYYENLTIYKNITLTSNAIYDDLSVWAEYSLTFGQYELLNDNIDNTVINGSLDTNGEDLQSVIYINSPEDECIEPVIFGFTITGGDGTKIQIGYDNAGNPIYERRGGGFYSNNALPEIHYNYIHDNNGTSESPIHSGGGTDIDLNERCEGDIDLSYNFYRDNDALYGNTLATNGYAGSLDMSNSIFDVYNCPEEEVTPVWVDVEEEVEVDFQYSAGDLCSITEDVWVSPDGDDYLNTGTSASNAFLTIETALALIAPDSTNIVTINLTEGTFSPSTTGENFSIIMLSYVNLIGQGEDVTIIDAEQTDRVIIMENCEGSTISELTITGGHSGALWGGGIRVVNSESIITNVSIISNYAEFGGGMFGGAYLDNVTIADNNAFDGGGIYGGGTLINCLVKNNTASNDGGGIYGSGYFENVIISGNVAQDWGGGIYMGSYSGGLIKNVIIENNIAGMGGGIAIKNGSPILENVLIQNNRSDNAGGGMSIEQQSIMGGFADPTIKNVTITGNITLGIGTGGGGGIYTYNYDLEMSNSIIWNNVPESIYLIGSSSDIMYSDIEGDTTWTGEGNINIDPLFTDTDNDDYTLQAGSPCIDAGTVIEDMEYCGDAPDMGAYEYCEELSTVSEIHMPINYSLNAAYPNPFNPVTSIAYNLPENGNVELIVYNIQGRQIETLINDFQTAGYYSINWNATSYPSGVYLIRMESGEFTQTQKVVLVK